VEKEDKTFFSRTSRWKSRWRIIRGRCYDSAQFGRLAGEASVSISDVPHIDLIINVKINLSDILLLFKPSFITRLLHYLSLLTRFYRDIIQYDERWYWHANFALGTDCCTNGRTRTHTVLTLLSAKIPICPLNFSNLDLWLQIY